MVTLIRILCSFFASKRRAARFSFRRTRRNLFVDLPCLTDCALVHPTVGKAEALCVANHTKTDGGESAGALARIVATPAKAHAMRCATNLPASPQQTLILGSDSAVTRCSRICPLPPNQPQSCQFHPSGRDWRPQREVLELSCYRRQSLQG